MHFDAGNRLSEQLGACPQDAQLHASSVVMYLARALHNRSTAIAYIQSFAETVCDNGVDTTLEAAELAQDDAGIAVPETNGAVVGAGDDDSRLLVAV